MRITIDYKDGLLSVQIVNLKSASEEEVENLRCFVTEFIASVPDADLKEEYVVVSSAGEAAKIEDKDIKIFSVSGAEYIPRG